MKDLKLLENDKYRNELWNIFEDLADEHRFLYNYLSTVKKIPEKYSCELCFLFNLMSENVTPKLKRKLTLEEASALVSIFWGNMERRNNCTCDVVSLLNGANEATRRDIFDR
jgi:hypothetical protein